MGSVIHSYWSIGTGKSFSSAATTASSKYFSRFVVPCLKQFMRPFSSNEDSPDSFEDSSHLTNYAVLGNGEQRKIKFVDELASMRLDQALDLTNLEREHGIATTSRFAMVHSSSSQRSLEESIRAAVKIKNYQKLLELLNTSDVVHWNPNLFSFLSRFSENERIHVVDEILQSLIPIRPRSRPYAVYSCLLSHILERQNPLPLALAIIQRILRSGCLPVPQIHLLLSKAWAKRRQQSQSVSSLLLEMDSIGYHPDCGTCNYLILSLCKIDQFEEAVKVLHGMSKACIPDLDSYGILIGEMSELRKTSEVVEMVKEMVDLHGLSPRKETILKALDAMRANRDIWRAADMIEYLESKGVCVGFGAYELALEGCLEDGQFVLAGKLAVRMAERGFIPYIKVRQRVIEVLTAIGEYELATVVRQRFVKLGS